jgi:plastocyanin
VTITRAIRVPSRLLVCAVVALVLLASGIGGATAAGARAARTHTVTIEGTAFRPDTLRIAAGDTVRWINKDPFPHTATAIGGAFDSKTIDVEKLWKVKLTKRGDYDYVCALHPTMKARLIVE